MSLLLAWDNPETAYTPKHRRVALYRGGKEINDDITWGVVEDPEETDPRASYCVRYFDGQGQQSGQVLDHEIIRYARPSDVCKITFDLVNIDGSPKTAEAIEVTDEATGSGYRRRVFTNSKGHAEVFLRYGVRAMLRVGLNFKALDCAIPSQADISFEDLAAYGSWVDSDNRGHG